MNIATSRRAATTLAATALLLTACRVPYTPEAKFAEQGPRAIAEASFAEMQDLTSVRALGNFTSTFGPAKFDMQFDDAGNCRATFDFDHGSAQLLKNAQGVWVKLDDNFWRSNSSPQVAARAMKAYDGKWLTSTKKTDLEGPCDFDEFASEFTLDENDTDDLLIKGEVEDIGDVDAIAIDGNEGKQHMTVWIDVKAPHRVIKLAPTDDTTGLEAYFFNDFNADVVVETPDAKDVVHVAEIGR